MKKINLEDIKQGNTYLGIEFGSTRIKAVLINSKYEVVAIGAHDWENDFKNGIWTYELKDAIMGMQSAYRELADAIREEYGTEIRNIGAIGISAMMHGYLPFDKGDNQLTEFRTWRNTITEQAARELTELFSFNIPQRWSIAHLYQAILNKEEHIKNISYITTLAGYIHQKLTGNRVLGVGEASGVFPIDENTVDYDKEMIEKFNRLLNREGMSYDILDILPKVLNAGKSAGVLTEDGARLLDPSGMLQSGIEFCAPEGDAGTGMVATNSVGVETGNISAGTSIFAMTVLKKKLSNVHTEIDMVTTPDGKPVAMVHCNTCTSDLNEWVNLFDETLKLFGADVSKSELYEKLYKKALEGSPDCSGMVAYNYFASENITAVKDGCPVFARSSDKKMTISDFMRTHIYSAMATLKIGMDILENEGAKVKYMLGHGGLFKTPVVAQKFMAGALNIPVVTMETAGEGGPWGMAILASYMKNREDSETLDMYLKNKVFLNAQSRLEEPEEETVNGFKKFISRYKECLEAEKIFADKLIKG